MRYYSMEHCVTVMEARLTSSVAVFGHMNLSVEARYGGQTYRTREIQGNDENPVWQETLVFAFEPEARLRLRVLHKTLFHVDAEVGACEVALPLGALTQLVLKKGVQETGTLTLCGESELPQQPRSALGVADLRTELLRRLSELEREKQEVRFEKEKNQRKMERLSEKKRIYSTRLQALETRQQNRDLKLLSPVSPPKLSLSEDLTQRQQSLNFRESRLLGERKRIQEERVLLTQEKERLLREKEELAPFKLRESGSDEHLRKARPVDLDREWQDIDKVRAALNDKQRILEAIRERLREEQRQYSQDIEDFERFRQRMQLEARPGRPQRSERAAKSPYSKSSGSERAGRLLVFT